MNEGDMLRVAEKHHDRDRADRLRATFDELVERAEAAFPGCACEAVDIDGEIEFRIFSGRYADEGAEGLYACEWGDA